VLANVNYFSFQNVRPEGGVSRKKMPVSREVKPRDSVPFTQCAKGSKRHAAGHIFRKSASANNWRKVFLHGRCKAPFDNGSLCLVAVVLVMRRTLNASDRRCRLCDTCSKWEGRRSQQLS